MQPNPAFGYEQVVTELIRGVIETVADKPGLSPERRASATQTVVCSVMAFNPRDPVEAMMAGQCVVYDHMLRDGAREMLRGQAELITIQARPGILACGKIFLGTVALLLRMQRRPEVQLAFARQLPAQEEVREDAAAVPNDASETAPVAARTDSPAGEAGPPAQTAAPRDPPSVTRPAASVSPPAAVPAGVRDKASGAATAAMPQRTGPDQRAAAPVPAPERHPDAIAPPVPAMPALMSQELIEEILFDGIDPALRQEIIAAASRATRGGG